MGILERVMAAKLANVKLYVKSARKMGEKSDIDEPEWLCLCQAKSKKLHKERFIKRKVKVAHKDE